MSKDVDRSQVLKSIKIMKAVKTDGSWIHKSNQEMREQDKARTDVAKDDSCSPVKKKSHVRSTIKKFESAATPLSHTLSKKKCSAITAQGSNVDHTVAKISTIPDMMVSTGLFQSPTGSHVVPEDVVKSLPETSAANKVTPGDGEVLPAEDLGRNGEAQPEIPVTTPGNEEVLQGAMEPVPVTVPKSPPQSAAEATVKSEGSAVETTDDAKNISLLALSAIMKFKDVETEEESASPTEGISETRSEEAVECEVQLVNTIAEQSVESVPQNPKDLVRDLSISDALQTVIDLEDEAGLVELSYRAIKLTGALDVEPPTADSVPEPVGDLEQSQSEQAKIDQSDDAHTTEMSQKPWELPRRTSNVKAVCSFCDQIIDGKTKLILNEPVLTCHPECLQCGVCAKGLGELLYCMFLHDQVIHCDACFANALMA